MDSSAISAAPTREPKNNRATKYRSFCLEMEFQADFPIDIQGQDATLNPTQVRIKLLTDHLRLRTGNDRPTCVTSHTMFFDASLLSRSPDRNSFTIQLEGYVQTNNGTSVARMSRWMDAVWKPVPGGLASDPGYRNNIKRSEDPSSAWTQIRVYGSVGLNNMGRSLESIAQKVGFFFFFAIHIRLVCFANCIYFHPRRVARIREMLSKQRSGERYCTIEQIGLPRLRHLPVHRCRAARTSRPGHLSYHLICRRLDTRTISRYALHARQRLPSLARPAPSSGRPAARPRPSLRLPHHYPPPPPPPPLAPPSPALSPPTHLPFPLSPAWSHIRLTSPARSQSKADSARPLRLLSCDAIPPPCPPCPPSASGAPRSRPAPPACCMATLLAPPSPPPTHPVGLCPLPYAHARSWGKYRLPAEDPWPSSSSNICILHSWGIWGLHLHLQTQR